MRMFTSVAIATAISAFATSVFAGGLSDEIIEAPVEVMEVEEPSGSSVNPTFVILGVLAALLVAAALQEEDDDDDDETDLIS